MFQEGSVTANLVACARSQLTSALHQVQVCFAIICHSKHKFSALSNNWLAFTTSSGGCSFASFKKWDVMSQEYNGCNYVIRASSRSAYCCFDRGQLVTLKPTYQQSAKAIYYVSRPFISKWLSNRITCLRIGW